MPDMIAVKPADPTLKLRNPSRGMRWLSPDGELVPSTIFWQRRLRAGDVVAIPDDEWAKIVAARKDAAEKDAAKKKDAADKDVKAGVAKATADTSAKPSDAAPVEPPAGGPTAKS